MENSTLVPHYREKLIEDLQFTFIVDEVTTHLSELICGIGILLNTLLIFVIFTRTPSHMKGYAVLLFNFAFFDLMSCIASLLACQKVLFSGFSLTYVFHGPCKHVAPWLCYLCHCFECHSLAHSQWILLISFIYRYRILIDDQPSVIRMVQISIALYSMSFVVFVFYYLDRGNSEDLLKIMSDLHPGYHFEDEKIWGKITVSGNTTMISPASLTAISYMTCTCVPIYVGIQYFRKKTLSCLESAGLNIPDHVKASHAKLIQALTVQAILPIFWLVASGIFTLAEFGIISGPLPENITFRLMDCVPMSSPIAAFVFIAPYRQGLSQLISKTGLYKLAENRIASTAETTTQQSVSPHPVQPTETVPVHEIA